MLLCFVSLNGDVFTVFSNYVYRFHKHNIINCYLNVPEPKISYRSGTYN